VNAQPNELPSELELAWRTLDAQASRRAARIDADAVASRVLARLREASEPAAWPRLLPGRWPWSSFPVWARVAAAVLVVGVAGTLLLGGPRSGGAPALGVPVLAAGLDSLSATQLESLLRVTAEVRPVAARVEPVAETWDDLSESQLQAVLQAVQQVEGGSL
jgi:hypothetical protein